MKIYREVAPPPSLFGCFRQAHPGDKDIHRAARENNIELLWRTLWDNEGTVYPVDILNADGNTALQIACVQGNLEIVQLLYGADADLDYSPGNISPLQYAVSQGHNNIVEFLTPRVGCAQIVRVQTPRVAAAIFTGTTTVTLKRTWNLFGDRQIHTAARFVNPILMRQVLDNKVPARYSIEILNRSGQTALQVAIRQCSLSIVKMLVAAGAHVDHTHLGDAAVRGFIYILEYLVPFVANIDAADSEGKTALTKACLARKKNTTKALLRNGADPAKILPGIYNELPDEFKNLLQMR